MNKNELKKLRKTLLAVGLAGVVLSTNGCKKEEESKIPEVKAIDSDYYDFDKYSKTIMIDGEAQTVYNRENIYLLYDKENYEVNEYIFSKSDILGDLTGYAELYDLETRDMLFLLNIATSYNRDYYEYLLDTTYQVGFNDLGNYIEGIELKDYYSLDEIKELEPQILSSLKKINAAKQKTK